MAGDPPKGRRVMLWGRRQQCTALDGLLAEVRAGRVLVCAPVALELVRLAPNEQRAHEVATRLAAFEAVPMPEGLWLRAQEVQLLLAPEGGHRVPQGPFLASRLASAVISFSPLSGALVMSYPVRGKALQLLNTSTALNSDPSTSLLDTPSHWSSTRPG